MKKEPKLKDLNALALQLHSLRKQGKSIVHCHGVFDLLHVGHIRHLEEARAMGDLLVVTVTPDEFVDKGPRRPVFDHQMRAEVLAALDVVDHVAISRWPTAVEAIKLLRPNIYVKGPDYKDAAKDITGGISLEEAAVRAVDGELRFTDGITFSSSGLVNRNIPLFPPEVDGYLNQFREEHQVEEIRESVESLRSLKVLVIGEVILDEYVYCDALAKSGKESVLAMRYLSREMYAGGVLAIANHLADFCDRVDLLSYLGETDSREEFVRGQLKQNIDPTFIVKSASPTIIKRRYLDAYSLVKLFAVYQLNDEFISQSEEDEFRSVLKARVADYDLVIVADFGHGLITPGVADSLTREVPFLAVNTQINAANIGFHTISKYRRVDFVCIQEGEIRLDSRSRRGKVAILAEELGKRLQCSHVLVTRGKYGTLLYRTGEGVFECPSLAGKVVDRVGAGDAVLAITSLCVAKDLPNDVIGFIGNLVGAQAVGTVGNSASVSRVSLLKSIEALLK